MKVTATASQQGKPVPTNVARKPSCDVPTCVIATASRIVFVKYGGTTHVIASWAARTRQSTALAFVHCAWSHVNLNSLKAQVLSSLSSLRFGGALNVDVYGVSSGLGPLPARIEFFCVAAARRHPREQCWWQRSPCLSFGLRKGFVTNVVFASTTMCQGICDHCLLRAGHFISALPFDGAARRVSFTDAVLPAHFI